MTGSTPPREHPRSLPFQEWPAADRHAWDDACPAGCRLKPGGAASYLAQVSREDFAGRYGAFLGFLQRTGRLDPDAAATAQVPALLNRPIEIYLNQSRPALIGSRPPSSELWISSTTGEAMTKKNLGTLISKITLETLGVDVSPHLFRTAAASMAAAYGGNTPHLASAILNHTDPRVTDEHYIRSTSVSAAKIYAEMVSSFVHE